MATRGEISYLVNGECTTCYVHFDAYVDGLGLILYENYKDVEKVTDLIALGDLSSVSETVEDSVAYCRDRGEDFRIRTYPFKDHCVNEEYSYVYSDGEWYRYFDGGRLLSLNGLFEENENDK